MNKVILQKWKTLQIIITYWSLYIKLTGKNQNSMVKTEENLLPMPEQNLYEKYEVNR